MREQLPAYFGLPTWDQFKAQLQYQRPPPEHYDMRAPEGFDADVFNGHKWALLTSQHWTIPLVAIVCYLVAIPLLRSFMQDREKMPITKIIALWNFALSAFSFCGVFYTVPHVLFGPAGLISQGWYASICSHPSSYGHDKVGLFVCLFIYSKLAELVDTLWLLLRKNQVILLHWYHHTTVLLFCWHAYSTSASTGIYFAAMNYSVHAIMYLYFGFTQLGPKYRKMVRPFAFYITMLQLAQMVGGIVVSVSTLGFIQDGTECHTIGTNVILALLMYASYFVLFLHLALDHYVFKPKQAKSAEKAKKDK